MKHSNKNTPSTPDPSPTLVASELAGPYDFGMAAFRLGDYPKAATWFRKAAEQGDAKSQYILGMMYMRGEGVQQSYSKAVPWLRKAIEQGYDPDQEDG